MFGPDQRDGQIDESSIKSYKLYAADSPGNKLGDAVAVVAVEEYDVPTSCILTSTVQGGW